eukprot:6470221-Amphidinium_carterae.1
MKVYWQGYWERSSNNMGTAAMVGEIVGRISEQYSQDSEKRQSLLEDTSRTCHPGSNCSKTSNREDKERPDHNVCNRGKKWGQARGTSEQDSEPSNEERSKCGERERVPLDMPTSCYLATLNRNGSVQSNLDFASFAVYFGNFGVRWGTNLWLLGRSGSQPLV